MLIGLLSAALAQAPPTAGNVQTLHNSADSLRTLWTDDAARAPDGYAQFRGISSLTSRPLVWEDPTGEVRSVVGGAWQLDAIASVSYGRFRVAADLPLQLATSSQAVPGGGTGLGDLTVDGKATILDPARGPIGFAVSSRLALPTATVSVPLGGNGLAWEVAAIADYSLGPVLLAVNLGTRGGRPTTLGPAEIGDQFLYRAGAGWEVTEGYGASMDLAGRVAYSGSAGSPAELMIGGWGWLSDSIVLRGGFGAGLGKAVGSPDARVLIGIGYEPPRNPDADEDGLVDRVDQCPSRPEDPDGFEDEDGCPDLDDDADGVFDVVDECKMEPEDRDGYRDEDGCPDPKTRLGIRLQDENGATAVGATAVVICGEMTRTVGPDHAFSIVPGPCRVEASAEGYESASASFEVPPGPPFEQIVQLQPKMKLGTVQVRVRVPGGKRPERAAWAFDGGDYARIHQGDASIALPPGEHHVFVSAPGYLTQDRSVTVSADGEVTVAFELVPMRVVVTRKRIEFDEKVHFETGSAVIKPDSFELLDAIADVLLDRTDIIALRIEGHTDSRGSEAYNQELSEDRAASVMAYLVAKGVEAGRLSAIGVGEAKPLDPRRNPLAHAANRRVEMHIDAWAE